MSDDLERLLREHYRRAATDVRPDAELIARYRNTAPSARNAPSRAQILLTAAAVITVALLTWGFLHGTSREVPATPPPASDLSPLPDTRAPSPRAVSPRPPAPRRSPTPRPRGPVLPSKVFPRPTTRG